MSRWNILKAPLATLEHRVERSSFDLSHNHLTSFNVGTLVPVYVQEIIPGDTIKLDAAFVARTSTMIYPVMDTAFLDYSFFFVPNRLLQKNWVKLMGENPDTPYAQPVVYTTPQITPPVGGWNKGTVADHMGLPTKIAGNASFNHLPFRAYVKIWNDFFRDQNLQPGAAWSDGDAVTSGSNGTDAITDAVAGGSLLPANKMADYFTTLLPSPQKGSAVKLPLGLTAPVVGNPNVDKIHSQGALIFGTTSSQNLQPGAASWGGADNLVDAANRQVNSISGSGTADYLRMEGFTGLYTDLSTATAATINDLRLSFMTQRLLEIDSVGGTRYTEMIQSHYGVINPDARLQRAEFLGGKRNPLTTFQVAQTSASTDESPQANIAAFGYTNDKDFVFEKSFTEFGFIIGVATVRPVHTYQYGADKFWFKKGRFDYHFPVFNHLGEQPVYNREIYMAGIDKDNEVFGYQEYGADLRMRFNKVTGAFRSNYSTSLDAYHYADKYDSMPMLNDSWIRETLTNFDRTLAVQSKDEDQILCDLHFNVKANRVLPVYSVPAGLGGRY